MRTKLTKEQAARLLRMIGLSYRRLGKLADTSGTTARRVLLGIEGGFYKKDTAAAVWKVVDEHKKSAGAQIQKLRQAA